MAKHYVTFGQRHIHQVNGHLLNKDSVACFEANSWAEGREEAFNLFHDEFFTDYHGDEFDMKSLEYFPRGIINIDQPNNI